VTRRPGRLPFVQAAAATALLLGFCSSSVFASSGVSTDGDEVNAALSTPALPSPSLNIKKVDLGLVNATADMQASAARLSAEKMTSPTLADDIELTDDVEDDDANDTTSPVNDTAETAVRLPGVAEQDLPHFRRQMYRTDI